MKLVAPLWEKQKRNKKGAAMIAVLCVLAVVTAICLSLLLASYQMFASTNDQPADIKYYQQALSLSNVVQHKLLTKTDLTVNDGSAEYFITRFMSSQADSTSWSFSANPGNGYNNIQITMLKTSPANSNSTSTSTTPSASETSSNGWLETYHFLKLTFDAMDESGVSHATVSDLYKFEYTSDSYDYIFTNSDTTKTVDTSACTLSSDKTVLTLTVKFNESGTLTTVSHEYQLSALALESGVINDGNFNGILSRSVKKSSSDTNYEFISLGKT